MYNKLQFDMYFSVAICRVVVTLVHVLVGTGDLRLGKRGMDLSLHQILLHFSQVISKFTGCNFSYQIEL